MNRSELKKFVTTVLLEKLDLGPSVQGKLVKKTLSFRGIERENVCEGTVEDANAYASANDLEYTSSDDSYFGGHFNNEMTSYEFHPDPEFYGELMETSMSAREQLSRICGTNDQILTEVDVQVVENIVDFICTNKTFKKDRTNLVFERIESSIKNRLYDKTQFTKMFEYLINQSCRNSTTDQIELSESEMEYATKLLSKRFFDKRLAEEEVVEDETKCGKKSFKAGSAFENMQRIVSGHQMFL